eukprot:361550-Chlamydomonas_euryale.AAC.3
MAIRIPPTPIYAVHTRTHPHLVAAPVTRRRAARAAAAAAAAATALACLCRPELVRVREIEPVDHAAAVGARPAQLVSSHREAGPLKAEVGGHLQRELRKRGQVRERVSAKGGNLLWAALMRRWRCAPPVMMYKAMRRSWKSGCMDGGGKCGTAELV